MAELPQNWQKEYLTDICNVYQPKTISTKELLADGSYPVYGANGQIGYYDKYNHEFSEVLITCRGATCGNINKSVPKSWINGNAMVASPISNAILDKNYLFYYLKNTSFDDYISGTAQPQITRTSLTKMPVIYPPLNEQKRIVEKLDKIIRIVDGVNARLDKIPTALKRARQSILNQAITGELTKDWRKKNAYSSAKELISKLEIEKNNIYAKECEIAKSNETKKPQKPKYFRIANNVLDINIPNQWSFINLSQTIYDFKYGTSTKSDYSYKGIPVIRIPNISNMKLSFDDLKYLNLSDIDSSNKIKKDDILIVRSNGSRDLVGKNALVKELDKEYAFASYLIRMRPLINNPEYLILLLNTDAIKEQFFSKAKSSAGINNINTEELATTIIPLPPLEEQAEIVRRVKLAFEKLDKIELRYQKAKEYSDKLTQSILNKAFRGELVPQDPNDKPIEIEV